jgi:hypothetical protein
VFWKANPRTERSRQDSEAIIEALVETNRLLRDLTLKSVDAALTPGYNQMDRIAGEQRTEQVRGGDDSEPMPPPIGRLPRPHVDDYDAVASIDVPTMGGGMGA